MALFLSLDVVVVVGIALAAVWLYYRVSWIRAVNRLPRRTEKKKFWIADLEIWHAPCVPGTSQPDVLPLLKRFVAKLTEGGDGLGVLWLFNPFYLPFARPLVLLWDPELIREMLEPRNYGKFNKGSFYTVAEPLFGQGVQSANDGPVWTCQRHLAQQGFCPKVLHDIVPVAKAALDHLFVTWDELAAKQESVPVQGDMRRLALDVFGKAALDFDMGALDAAGKPSLCAALDCALEVFDNLGRASPFLWWHLGGPRYNNSLAEVDALARDIVQKSEAAAPKGRFPSLLGHLTWSIVGPQGRDPVLGPKLVLDNVKTFLLAGHDTTASSLAWALWLLAGHRDAQGRLQQEVDDFFKAAEASGEAVSPEALRKLEFLDAVIKETLRLYPAMAVARAPASDMELGPSSRSGGRAYVVPRGCDVLVLPSLVHRDPASWPQPDAFMPDRWLEKGAVRPCAFLPFGFGRRSCIGQEFALTELRIVLASIVRRYQLRSDADSPEPRPVLRFSTSPSPFSLRLERRAAQKA